MFRNMISLISDFLLGFCLRMLCSIVANFGTHPLFGAADPYLPDRVEFKQTSLLNLRQEMLFVFTDNSKDNIKTQL